MQLATYKRSLVRSSMDISTETGEKRQGINSIVKVLSDKNQGPEIYLHGTSAS